MKEKEKIILEYFKTTAKSVEYEEEEGVIREGM